MAEVEDVGVAEEEEGDVTSSIVIQFTTLTLPLTHPFFFISTTL